MNIDEKIRQNIKYTDLPTPLWDGYFYNLSLWIWKDFKFEYDVCETEPYKPDGEIPLIFIRAGWFEVGFYNKFIYKYLYRIKLGYYPGGLKSE